MRTLFMKPTKACCTTQVQRLNRETLKYETRDCGYRVMNYVEGTKKVRCLDCLQDIEIPEEKDK